MLPFGYEDDDRRRNDWDEDDDIEPVSYPSPLFQVGSSFFLYILIFS